MPIDFNRLHGGTGVGSMNAGRVVSMHGGSGGGGSNFTGNGSAAWMQAMGQGGGNVGGQLQSMQDQANARSAAQYRNLMRTVKKTNKRQTKLFKRAQGLTKGMGKEAIADATMQGEQQQGSAMQGLISRGLGNTTIQDSVSRGINSDTARNIRGIKEGVNSQRAGLYTQQAGAALPMGQFGADSILSRQNNGPNVAQYIQLLQQMAANGGGMA